MGEICLVVLFFLLRAKRLCFWCNAILVSCALCFNYLLFQAQKTFEMKVNISGTELVVLENVKTVDTHAVVLKVFY